ncbi:carboxylesterase/lipase family protein [Paenibacillus mesotrionivorans]|uniref:Carboxylesterase/lipase family protein n=1 Tax=Paenibacillus mesotrionivorans TaxID=3160968 RepID=A0ACC7P359_9BACL
MPIEKPMDQNLRIETAYGWVQGIRDGNVCAFLGLPYAAIPAGADSRFKPPLPLQPWSGVRKADAFGSTAPQPNPLPYNSNQSEDCLTLNIWTDNTDKPERPVLVYIHGGGFTSGSGSNPSFNGRTFAENGGVVAVTLNYRLGVLGFLDLSSVWGGEYRTSGNTGLLDIIAALQWIRENIGSFGGNPNRVTVMGQSAGAKCVGALLCAPPAEGLFHRAIAISGSVQAVRDQGTSAELTERFLHHASLSSRTTNRLLTMPAEELMALQQDWVKDLRGVHYFGPVIDGHTLKTQPLEELARPGRTLPPLLIGTSRNETAGFIAGDDIMQRPSLEVLEHIFGRNAGAVQAAYERRSNLPLEGDSPNMAVWEAVMTDYMYRIAAIRTAEAYAAAGAPVWLYRFDAGGPQGAGHGSERPYIWHNGFPPARSALAERMHQAWIRFIHGSEPEAAGSAASWPPFERTNRRILLFNDPCCISGLEDVLNDPDFPMQSLVL